MRESEIVGFRRGSILSTSLPLPVAPVDLPLPFPFPFSAGKVVCGAEKDFGTTARTRGGRAARRLPGELEAEGTVQGQR